RFFDIGLPMMPRPMNPIVDMPAIIGESAKKGEDRMERAQEGPRGRYATVNGLRMYYEIHGSGRPVVFLHGGATTIDTSFWKILPAMAETRRVIAIEQEAHGHTKDLDRPLKFEQMADDTAALLRYLEIDRADFFGYSMGGIIGLGIAIRHPQLVNRLVV